MGRILSQHKVVQNSWLSTGQPRITPLAEKVSGAASVERTDRILLEVQDCGYAPACPHPHASLESPASACPCLTSMGGLGVC